MKKFIPYDYFPNKSDQEMQASVDELYKLMLKRRTVRDYDSRTIPEESILKAIQIAGLAPNGANKQPWHFVLISNPEIKKEIRIAAEKEEADFYLHKPNKTWLKDLEPLGTNEEKPFLEEAPYLIAIFAENHELDEEEKKKKNYYVSESVGIATGMLITALHIMGLSTLTHTPSPMGFMRTILKRPQNEKPYILLVVGHPKEGAMVPNITKKSISEICTTL
ncbi:MAG: nitroreductase family protein [Halobacteriovoraceae bacterium]|jgi:iodotyrosine deiodinase|nr:nitroreductase family protein [Halobacteriovoraceae bacterium]MBT5093989.1 nitroreductase family protein [Halobacteriovoraceae bacterium]